MSPESSDICVEIKSLPSEVGRACASLVALCNDRGLGREHGYPLELSLAEALNNVLEHAFHFEPDHHIEVSLKLNEQLFSMAICYCSERVLTDEHFKGAELPDAEDFPDCGFGNYLLTRLMDRINVAYEDGKTLIHMEKDNPGANLANPG